MFDKSNPQNVRAQSEGGLDSGEAAELQIWVGVAWLVGCLVWGSLSLQRSRECHISRQYLCQACLSLAALSSLALNNLRQSSIINVLSLSLEFIFLNFSCNVLIKY